MFTPEKLLTGTLQSENFVPESSPGARDGQGWRLRQNGELEISRAMVDKVRIKPAQLDLPIHKVHGDRPCVLADSLNQPRNYTIDLVVTLQETSPERVEALSQSIKQIVMDAIESDQRLSGVGMGLRSGRITEEATARAEADTALISRIGAIDLQAWAGVGASLDLQLGKEYLATPQPDGDVKLSRLGGKPITAADFKPGNSSREFAGGLCRVAPMTANGKVPLNNLPRPVDDDK